MHCAVGPFRMYPAVIALISLFASVLSPYPAARAAAPYEQEFLVTAYYSPLPGQCCYYRGDYASEIIFNGNGTHGADGTPVYPGMIAAPSSYAFGTRIELPGVGVGTVHDRGGRIIEWGNGTHRIDLWMGHGEEGLARALEWGARQMKGIVYPLGSEKPAESLSLDAIPAPASSLAYAPQEEKSFLLADASAGDISVSVSLLQQELKELGFFSHAITNTYGPVTQTALADFLSHYGLDGDGSEADDAVRAAILAARSMDDANLPRLGVHLQAGATGSEVAHAQRVLRYIGAYKGRTNGIYTPEMTEQVLAFQLEHGVIPHAGASGAGRIGPKTREAILEEWKRREVRRRAQEYLTRIEAEKLARGILPGSTLARGSSGAEVRVLQRLLARLGFFPQSAVNGTFGTQTEEAVRQYQLAREILGAPSDHGAGVFGPATKMTLAKDAAQELWRVMRAFGTAAAGERLL